MTLSKLLKKINIVADYIYICNQYDNAPDETIRLNGDVLDAIHDAVSNSVPYSRNWSLAQYLMKSSQEDGLAEKDRDKLIEWLNMNIECIQLKDGEYKILLYK